ncbi:Cytochrome c, mono-and diheme variants [Nitratiruptor tergarcus DSM 16512]|uniref:Cytochrome c, mono-and diheme variants n=1 Tax=Nitratiruptor tergarcus DSM 16512 TaxID=1069081 RepID=A0A1W1WQX1_9BACT|nr:cytochrome D1 domain-containing protein [Nitratiruptor tergarcus]SMC08599.1 Cytochrome c, mono-and diheme variants [Nitratiruptor tergarcus DSM 16512]
MKRVFFSLFFIGLLHADVLIHELEAKSSQKSGYDIYYKYCSMCHGKQREGISAPPLLPSFIKRMSDERLRDIIKNSLPQTLMPKFDFLSDGEVAKIIAYLRSPAKNIRWTKEDIKKSKVAFNNPKKNLGIKNIENITLVVERGANRVWVMENEKVLDRFSFVNVHGGLKYTLDGKNFYVPTRDGWIGHYSLEHGRVEHKIRACVNLRNISLSRDGKYLFATCLLPQMVVVFDRANLVPVKTQKVQGKISALYELYSKDEAVFTLRNKPELYRVDTKTLEFKKFPLDKPIEDFFIDPFEEYIIGTTRHGKDLRVYEIDSLKEVFHAPMEGMPHLFSATYWYKDGKFYFATPHLRRPFITVWQMYDWKLVKKIDVGGDGFFVKTHPMSDFLWVDNGSDELVLVDKSSFALKKIVPRKGKRYIHTEFSGDGKYAYLSIYESDGDLLVWQTDTFKELKDYSANVPVGKYNFINKNRKFYPRLFGLSLFKEKCWGCHHQTAMAFGPPFAAIAKKRTRDEMIAQILDPKNMYKHLGYKRNSMPAFKLSPKELQSITDYIMSFKDK